MQISVADPCHFGTDPDADPDFRIRILCPYLCITDPDADSKDPKAYRVRIRNTGTFTARLNL